MNSTITTKLDDTDIEADRTLVQSKLFHLQKLMFLEVPLIKLVAPLKEEFIKELVLDKTLLFIDKKRKLDRIITSHDHLKDKSSPPTSIRFKVNLTSPDKEVVASETFRSLRDEFDAGLEAFQSLARDIFLRTKNLEKENAEKHLQECFNIHFHEIVEFKTTYEIGIMPSKIDSDTINKNGGHAAVAAYAWKQIISKSKQQRTTLESNPALQLINNTSIYLSTTPQDFKKEIIKKFNKIDTTNLTKHFQTGLQIAQLDDLLIKIETFIIDITENITTNIYNTYSQFQREKEIRQKMKAAVQSRKIETDTTTVADLLSQEDPISAPKILEYVTTITNKQVQIALQKNSNSQKTTGKTNGKILRQKRKYPNNNNNNNHHIKEVSYNTNNSTQTTAATSHTTPQPTSTPHRHHNSNHTANTPSLNSNSQNNTTITSNSTRQTTTHNQQKRQRKTFQPADPSKAPRILDSPFTSTPPQQNNQQIYNNQRSYHPRHNAYNRHGRGRGRNNGRGNGRGHRGVPPKERGTRNY